MLPLAASCRYSAACLPLTSGAAGASRSRSSGTSESPACTRPRPLGAPPGRPLVAACCRWRRSAGANLIAASVARRPARDGGRLSDAATRAARANAASRSARTRCAAARATCRTPCAASRRGLACAARRRACPPARDAVRVRELGGLVLQSVHGRSLRDGVLEVPLEEGCLRGGKLAKLRHRRGAQRVSPFLARHHEQIHLSDRLKTPVRARRCEPAKPNERRRAGERRSQCDGVPPRNNNCRRCTRPAQAWPPAR